MSFLSHTSSSNIHPLYSVVICTRNRGAGLLPTLNTVFTNLTPAYEVIVVDQSANDDTKTAVASYMDDPRFRYIHLNSIGTGRSRNAGLFAARGEFVAYTDDDCTVPANWLDLLDNAFRQNSKTAIVYCKVIAPENRPAHGHIPVFLFDKKRVLRSINDCKHALGMGAGMAVRRSAVIEAGGFDSMFGPGSQFMSGEDYEIGVRMVMNGWEIFEDPEIQVTHYGFRTIDQYRKVAYRDWFAMGGVFAKYIKYAYFPIFSLIIHDGIVRGLIWPMKKIFRLKKPQGIRNFIFICQGFLTGLFFPTQPGQHLYHDPEIGKGYAP